MVAPRLEHHPEPGSPVFVAPRGVDWSFVEATAPSMVRGPGYDLCRVASRRVAPEDTAVTADGPDAGSVLRLIRTWA